MSTRMFYDYDCSLEALAGKTIVFVGYGNQGRAQASNLRDTLNASTVFEPPKIVIANREDDYAGTADRDGFGHTSDFAAAAAEADVLFLLVPDQHLTVDPSTDIVMVAPRMIGASVRSRFVSEQGFPCFVSVEQDGTGHAWPVALSLCLGIGATKGGVIESSCREETLLDLFAEQALFPMIIATFQESYKTLKRLGCSDEALCHEMWMSKEPAEVFEKMADDGFIRQLKLHSTVSQYGQLKGSSEVDTSLMVKEFKRVSEERILGGTFAKEFSALESASTGGVDVRLQDLYQVANESELARGERRVRERLGLPTS
ncbi:MAG: hypothetical protein Q9162_006276 [Coniocarpon cinnabarinum]